MERVDSRSHPITPSGKRLAAFLDGLGVETRWLPHQYIDWYTGEAVDKSPGFAFTSHCSAFVASVAARMGVYLLRPPEHDQVNLANSQFRWLRTRAAREAGWVPLGGGWLGAQRAANAGALVIAIVNERDRPGHDAVVRPSERDDASVLAEGPQVIMAGTTNRNSVPLAAAFRGHGQALASGRIELWTNPWAAVP